MELVEGLGALLFYLLEVSRPGNGGQGNRIVDPAWAAGQQRMVSQVALQYKPSANRIQNQSIPNSLASDV